jgi:hypothetical protein
MTQWLNNAAREAARRQNANAFAAWLVESGGLREMDAADAVTSEISLAGSEWAGQVVPGKGFVDR